LDDAFEIKLTVNDGIGILEWAGQTDQATLDRGVSLAADDALIGRGVERLEVQIPADDQMAMRALHRARFRREGRRRKAVRGPDGSWRDVLVYARLAIDQVYGPDGFSGVMNTVLPTHRIIGHVLFRDEAGRILLVETTYKDDWELPGGVVEPNEPPRVGAEREVLEELGIHVRLNQPLVVDWMPPYLGWDDAVEFIFDGGVLDQATIARMQLPETEIRAFRWVFEDEMDAHIYSLSARRLHRLLAGPTTIYTEDGRELD
jgi:8-oxo-dGTP pyrophosphatase MutT (NUDIX family)